MTFPRMHTDERDTDAGLVRRLLAAQHPRWADLPVVRVASAGTDHALYRLGDAMVVRLPRIAAAAGQVEKEQRWLPVLAPRLPLAIPRPLAQGEPGCGYPWRWSVYGWLEGENAVAAPLGDPLRAGADLGRFVRALRAVDATGAPVPGAHNFFRGVALAVRDAATREALASLDGEIDVLAATAAWDAALRAPSWRAAPVWIHGDLQPGNLLVRDGALAAVIDFGGLAAGDPACDLAVAWSFFTGPAREAFRVAIDADDASWSRGRGWALSIAAIALPYYRDTNPVLAAVSRRAIAEVLADAG